MLFSHDGIHDSETHLASPTYFYDQLKREISLSGRSGKPIALIKIIFDKTDSNPVMLQEILHFTHELSRLTRQEDCVGRLGINEIVIIVRDGKGDADSFVNRLLDATSLTVNHTLQIRIATVLGSNKENSLKLLERLDHAELVTR